MRKLKSKQQRTVRVMFERHDRETGKSKRPYLLAAAVGVLFFAGVAGAQYGQHPLLDAAANKTVQKYQNSSCEQLWQERGQPKSQREQEAVNFLRSDPQMRAMFIDRVAAPIANKMFECGMIP
jgi:hypothetical protein